MDLRKNSVRSRHINWLITGFLLLSFISLNFLLLQTTIAAESNSSTEDAKKNVILMIGDGMGYGSVKLARWVEFGTGELLAMEKLPFNLDVTTHTITGTITDSAAAGTALATGNKTISGRVAMDSAGSPLKTILQVAQEQGKATGIVTTTEVTHATPACFMTHALSRNDITGIAQQIVEESSVDVILGGGEGDFTQDQLIQLEANGYSVVKNRSALLDVEDGPIVGLFSAEHLPYEIDRNPTLVPSLREMTEKAIEILSKDSDGFFLMVEGGQIDFAGHANDKVRNALETIEFDRTVQFASSFAQNHGDTLLIVTADHETGGLAVSSGTLNESVPSVGMTATENETLRVTRALNITVTWASTFHTSATVPFYGYGGDFSKFENGSTTDNTEIFFLMQEFYAKKEKPTDQTSESTSWPFVLISLVALGSYVSLRLRKLAQ
ncbi:MAG: alkaline phosphatase [Candidatus Hodarchaeota archaeon]